MVFKVGFSKATFLAWPRPNLRFSASPQRAAAVGAFQEYSNCGSVKAEETPQKKVQIGPFTFCSDRLTIEAGQRLN